jgi:phosphoribosylaminoimidazole-succinocarboxamide synthase
VALPLLHTGSVKNVYGTEGVAPYVFEFSDRYSVFDWGMMPDLLERKGEALAIMANWFFEQLKAQGFEHHALGLSNRDGDILDSKNTSRCLAVKPVSVPRAQPERYLERPIDTLVPLEILFRFGIPQGSSLLERSHDSNVRKDLGLKSPVTVGQFFDRPLIEFSTKLESTDRMLSRAQAQELASLSSNELEKLLAYTEKLAVAMHKLFAKIDVELWDGKVECAFGAADKTGERSFYLVDSIGPDELRLMYHEYGLSKENLRQFYRSTPWYVDQLEAKKLARERGMFDWKDICKSELNSLPMHLPVPLKDCTEKMYQLLTDELLASSGQERVFDPSKTLIDWLDLRRSL